MLFNSYIFIFLFLPLAIAGWYLLNRISYKKAAQGYLIGMSLWFYAYFNVKFLWVIAGSCVFNYGISWLMSLKENKKIKKILLIAACVGNIGALGIFKYTNFILENVNTVFKTDFHFVSILLPLGISFITFQQLSFIIDRGRSKTEHCDLLDYLSFITFFPSLVSGPIVLHGDTICQFKEPERRKWNSEKFTKGVMLFCMGLGKKVLLADTFASGVNYGFENIPSLDSIAALLVALMYTLELYFDFSGYSDMAVGTGYLFGIDLPENFDSPYQAVTVKDFWKRWHKSLSTFLQNYVYFGLGGSRRGKFRTFLNTILTFLISGLWHGANWTFLFWGFLHGIGVAVSGVIKTERLTGKYNWKRKLLQICTFIYVCAAFVFFRADSISDGFALFSRIFSFERYYYIYTVAAAMEPSELYIVTKALSLFAPELISKVQLGFVGILLLISFLILGGKKSCEIVNREKYGMGFILMLGAVFVWSVLSLSGVSSFVYFSF